MLQSIEHYPFEWQAMLVQCAMTLEVDPDNFEYLVSIDRVEVVMCGQIVALARQVDEKHYEIIAFPRG